MQLNKDKKTDQNRTSSHTGFFYGWVIVAVSFLSLIVVFGIRLSFAVFFVALIEDFDWARADTSLIFSVSMLTFTLTSTVAGIALDRWGARLTFGTGAVILGVGLILSSRIETLWHLILAYGVVASLGITILGLGLQASLIARWFRRKRGLAIGLAFAGTGIGTLALTPGVERLITWIGWRGAYLALAGLAFAIIPAILLLRLNPQDKGLVPDGKSDHLEKSNRRMPAENWTMAQAFRNPGFWLVIVAALGAIGPVRMLTVHQLAAITDAGFSRAYAATMVGLAGAVTSLVFVLAGAVSDRIGRRFTYMLGSFSLLLAYAILNGLQSADQPIWLSFYVVLFGIGEGSRSSLVSAVASDLFPGNALGAINGAVGAAFGLGAAVLPWLAGRMFDVQGTYATALGVSALIVVIGTLALWFAPAFKNRGESPPIKIL